LTSLPLDVASTSQCGTRAQGSRTFSLRIGRSVAARAGNQGLALVVAVDLPGAMMRTEAERSNPTGARKRRASPAARHLALLIVTYVAIGVAIGAAQRAYPSLLAPLAPSSQSGMPGLNSTAPATASALSVSGVLRAGVAMLGALVLAIPVAWVYLITRRRKGFAQSVVHTILMLPLAVAGTMVLVQNSIPLAFSLAGLAVLRFRNTLDDTKDAIYLFVATGIGISSAAHALDVGLALSFLFSATAVVLWWTDLGRTPAKLKAKLTLEKLRETREMRIPVPADAAPADPWNAVLRVHASSADEAQSSVEAVLRESAKRFELTGVTPGEHGFQQIEYVVRLKPSTARGALLNNVRARGAPNVIGAEFR